MNVCAWILIYFIFKPNIHGYLLLTLLLSACTGLWLLIGSAQQYVGLSGSLHGLFGYFAMQEYLCKRKGAGLMVLCLLCKVSYENLFQPSGVTERLIELPIAYDSHLFGALSGLLLALLWHLYQCHTNRSE